MPRGCGGCCAGWGTTTSRSSTAASARGRAPAAPSSPTRRRAAHARPIPARKPLTPADRRRRLCWRRLGSRARARRARAGALSAARSSRSTPSPATSLGPRTASTAATSPATGASSRRRAARRVRGLARSRRRRTSVVHQCGSGVTACHNLLAMEHAGLRGSALYPGSWSEWSSDPRRPVAGLTRRRRATPRCRLRRPPRVAPGTEAPSPGAARSAVHVPLTLPDGVVPSVMRSPRE